MRAKRLLVGLMAWAVSFGGIGIGGGGGGSTSSSTSTTTYPSLGVSNSPWQICGGMINGKSDTWYSNVAKNSTAFEYENNALAVRLKVYNAPPLLGDTASEHIIHTDLGFVDNEFPVNTPYQSLFGFDDFTEASYYHHRTSGTRWHYRSSEANGCCTANETPLACCTGPGTGTGAGECAANTGGISDSWTGCTDPTGATCAASSRWDYRHFLHRTSCDGPRFPDNPEGDYEWVKWSDTHVRATLLAYLDFLAAYKCNDNSSCTADQTPWACCSGSRAGTCDTPLDCHFNGWRNDETDVAYLSGADSVGKGMDFRDIIELTQPASTGDSTYYAAAEIEAMRYVLGARPNWHWYEGVSLKKPYSEMPDSYITNMEARVHAAHGLSTEDIGGFAYIRSCDTWTGDDCTEATGTVNTAGLDADRKTFAELMKIMGTENEPNIRVLLNPYRPCRWFSWVEQMCAATGDVCYFDIVGAGPDSLGCYSTNGIIDPELSSE